MTWRALRSQSDARDLWLNACIVPALTLITSVLNGLRDLADAFESIGGATEGAIEHLVVDAKSRVARMGWVAGGRLAANWA